MTGSRLCWLFALVLGIGCSDSKGGASGAGNPDAGTADAAASAEDGSDAATNGDAAVEHGSDAATTGDAAVEDGSDAAVEPPPEPKPHRVVYWGDFETVDVRTLVVRDSETGDETKTELDSNAYAVAVSADATKIVVGSTAVDGTPHVQLYDPDDLSAAPTVIEEEANTSGTEFEWASIAPNSKTAVYVRKFYDMTAMETADELHFVDLTALSSAPQTLALPAGNLADAALFWSPDGSALGLVLDFNSATGGAWIASVDDAGTASTSDDTWSLQQVDAPCDEYKRVAWDAQERLYCLGAPVVDAGRRVYRFDPKAGTSAVQLDTGDALDITDLASSPDLEQLAYVAELDAAGNEDVFVMELATQKLTRLTQLGGKMGAELRDVVWRPDSRALLAAIEWKDAVLPGVSGSLLEITLGGATRQVDAPVAAYQVGAEDFVYSPDSASVYFTSDARIEGDVELLRLTSFATQTPDVDDLIVRAAVSGGGVSRAAVGPLP